MKEQKKTILECLKTITQISPDHIILQTVRDGTVKGWTYRDVELQVIEFAKQLYRYHLTPGSRIGIISETLPETIIVLFALFAVQCSVVIIDAQLPAAEINHLIKQADIKLLLVSDTIVSRLSSDILDKQPVLQIQNNLERLSSSTSKLPKTDDADNNADIALILFTSGSTGTYKAVMLSHQSILHICEANQKAFQLSQEDLLFSLLPIHHIGPFIGIVTSLIAGVTIHVLSKIDPKLIMEEVKLSRPTLFSAVPGLLNFLKQSIETQINAQSLIKRALIKIFIFVGNFLQRKLKVNILPKLLSKLHQAFGGRLKYFVSGAGILSVETQTQLEAWGFDLFHGYGLTETCGPVAYNQKNYCKLGSSGIALGDAKFKIHNPDEYGIGEICIQGTCLMQGYFRDEAATQKIIKEGWLHTGDLGYQDPEGFLFITGRIKDIIVTSGGKKAMPDDIEKYYTAIHGVKELTVVGVPNSDHTYDEIHAAVVIDTEWEKEHQIKAQELIEAEFNHRAKNLPHQMRIQKIHFVPQLPKTSTHKVKRYQLKKQFEQLTKVLKIRSNKEKIDIPKQRPQSPQEIENWLIQRLQNVTPTDAVITNDHSLIYYGLDSLALTELALELNQWLNINLSHATLMEFTILRLSIYIFNLMNRQENKLFKIERVPAQEKMIASEGQTRFWFIQELKQDKTPYNLGIVLKLEGTLCITTLKRACQQLIHYQPSLRTTFCYEDGKLYQKIHPEMPVVMEVEDLSKNTDYKTILDESINKTIYLPYDFTVGPLVRFKLIQISADTYYLVTGIHHVIFDGWSAKLMHQQLIQIYQSLLLGNAPQLPNLPVNYADYSYSLEKWYAQDSAQKMIQYWKEKLVDVPELSTFPIDMPRQEEQSFSYQTQSMTLNHRLTKKIHQFAHRNESTVFNVLFTAFSILLSRYSAHEKIVIGVPDSGRHHSEIQNVVGYFINILPILVQVNENSNFIDMLKQVTREFCQDEDNQFVPLGKLLREIHVTPNLNHEALFQIVFTMEDFSSFDMKTPGLTTSAAFTETGRGGYDLTVEVENFNNDKIKLTVIYNKNLYHPDTVNRILNHYQNLLNSILRFPQELLCHHQLMSKVELKAIINHWNKNKFYYPKHETLISLFEKQVKNNPTSIAVAFEKNQLTYQELNQKANQLATFLRQHNIGQEQFVGICIERSLELIISMLGVMKAGAAYIPLDPTYPSERLRTIVEDSQPATVIVSKETHALMDTQLIQPTFIEDALKTPVTTQKFRLPFAAKANNLAYIIYTSGSTGKPKGVLIEHRQIINTILSEIKLLNLSHQTIYLQFSSASFDASIWEIFSTLLVGGQLVMAKKENLLPGPPLLNLLNEHKINVVTLTPAVLSFMTPEKLPHLKTIVVAGEACTREIVSTWGKDRILINAYGPTETSICATTYICDPTSLQRPPIGKPFNNVKTYIVNKDFNPVPLGVEGELLIGGAGVARGYLNRPELDKEKFIQNPVNLYSFKKVYRSGDLCRYLPDGNIEFIGRIDNQVKLRGFRIELSEIENQINVDEHVQICHVMLYQDSNKQKQLAAYVVFKQGDSELDTIHRTQLLRDSLTRKLPSYMIPASFVVLEKLPITYSGKVDEKALPTPDTAKLKFAKFVAPETDLEKELCQIWKTVLKIDEVGVHDNFFELGGDSILSVLLTTQIHEKLKVQISLPQIFNAPTIKELAMAISHQHQADNLLVPINSETSDQGPVIICIHPVGGSVYCYQQLKQYFPASQPIYAIQSMGLIDKNKIQTDIREMALTYVKVIQEAFPSREIILLGWSMGGIIAYEMAYLMEKQAYPYVKELILVDSYLASQIEEFFAIKALFKTFISQIPGIKASVLDHMNKDIDSFAPDNKEQLFDLFKTYEQHLPRESKTEFDHLLKIVKANYYAHQHYLSHGQISVETKLIYATDTLRKYSKYPPELTNQIIKQWQQHIQGNLFYKLADTDHFKIMGTNSIMNGEYNEVVNK